MPKAAIHRHPYIDRITYIEISIEKGSINNNRYEESLLSTKKKLMDTAFKWACACPTTNNINKNKIVLANNNYIIYVFFRPEIVDAESEGA